MATETVRRGQAEPLSTLSVTKGGPETICASLTEPKRRFTATLAFMHSYSKELNPNLTKTLD